MVDFDSPVRSAIDARDQWVSLPGVDSNVAMTTSSTWSSRIHGGRPGRGLVHQPVEPAGDEPPPPPIHGRLVETEIGGGLLVRRPTSAQRSTILARIARY